MHRYPILLTRDVDELRIAVTRHYHSGLCEVPNYRDNFEIKYNHIFLDGFSVSSHVNRGHLHFESGPPENAYIIHFLPLTGVSEIQYGNERLVLTKERGCIISPFRNGVWDYYDEQSQILVRIERHEMEGHLEALLGSRLRKPLEFRFEMNMKSSSIAALRRLVLYMINELDQCRDFVRFAQSSLKETLIHGLFMAQPHTFTSQLLKKPPDSGPVYVRRVEEYVREHLGEELSHKELARMTGVSLRSLQLGFQKHRGYTLGRFIRKQRLLLARKNLCNANGRNVTEIALACGFNHPAQFAAYYKKEFGESPSETLKRAKFLLK